MSERPALLPRRSQGLKLLLVCGLALVMSIAALFVFLLLSDRTNRAREVTSEISTVVGGAQTFLGPVLVVPYVQPADDPKAAPTRGVFTIFPVNGEAQVAAKSELRSRSLFKVPIYKADVAFKAHFDLTGVAAQAPQGAALDWSRSELIVGASDARGAQADVLMSVGGQQRLVSPASTISESTLTPSPQVSGGGADGRSYVFTGNQLAMKFFGASAVGMAAPDAKFDVSSEMKFSGAERLSVLAFAKTTTLSVKSDWPHPSFDGGFLPTTRTIDDKGFKAAWSVPFIARGVPAQGSSDVLSRLGQTALGVSFVEPANPYQSVSRSLKYAPMFIGLVFLAYFLFETAQGKRVHAAQYVLIGLAQLVFYLLLLSIAERTGFDVAFIIAAGATVGLISAYAGWVFESRKQGFVALAAFTLLYVLIYVLMRLEDLALLIGALVSFAAIAAVMYFTRRLDWYGTSVPAAAAGPTPKEPA
jgi:inner membrane protein